MKKLLLAGAASAEVNNIVLVHGAYADGSCWNDMIARLQRAGKRVTSVQNPLTSLADDADATRRALALQDGPVVLVGHSWAGTVISETGVDPKVKALVYVAARAPDWKVKPTYYAVSANDRPTAPALERFLARCMGAKTIELPSSHLSMISHADEIAALILEAAK